MPRKEKGDVSELGKDVAFARELAELSPWDVALLAGVEERETLKDEVRAVLREQRGRRGHTVPVVLRLSSRLAAVLYGDGAKLYALSDPWAFLNMLRLHARRSLGL